MCWVIPDVCVGAAVSPLGLNGASFWGPFFAVVPHYRCYLPLHGTFQPLIAFSYRKVGAVTWQIDWSTHSLKFNMTWKDFKKEGNNLFFPRLTFLDCVFKCCFICPQTNSHKGELCKTEGCWDGKGSFIHLFLNVFVGVVCIVLFSLYVPLLITSDQFFRWFMQF